MARARKEETIELQEELQETTPKDTIQKAELRRRALLKVYKDEKKYPVNVSPLYKPYFGNAMTVSVNGITVVVPCDGKTYNLSETFANEVLERVAKVNAILEKANKLQNVGANFETTPGELEFF